MQIKSVPKTHFLYIDFNFCDLLKIHCGLSKMTQKQVAFIPKPSGNVGALHVKLLDFTASKLSVHTSFRCDMAHRLSVF